MSLPRTRKTAVATASLDIRNNTVTGKDVKNGSWRQTSFPGGGQISSAPDRLNLYGSCYDANGAVAVPAFDATVTLALTKRETVPDSTFH